MYCYYYYFKAVFLKLLSIPPLRLLKSSMFCIFFIICIFFLWLKIINKRNDFQNTTNCTYFSQVHASYLALISPDKVTELSSFYAVVPAFQRGITIVWKPSSHVLKCISHCAIRGGAGGRKPRVLPDGDSSGFSQSPPGSRFDGACLVSKCSFLSPPLSRAIVSKLVYICFSCFCAW